MEKNHSTEYGYIYVLHSDVSFTKEGLPYYKIGFTKNIYNRLNQLNSETSSALPYEVIFCLKCSNYIELEKQTHEKFKKDRLNLRREFFTSKIDDIIKFILDNAILEYSCKKDISKNINNQDLFGHLYIDEMIIIKYVNRFPNERHLLQEIKNKKYLAKSEEEKQNIFNSLKSNTYK